MAMDAPLPATIDQLSCRALFEAEPPAELFHYTDLDGVAGILHSRYLWLSKVSTLNDTSEINLAVQHFKAFATECVDGLAHTEAALLAEAAAMLDHFRRTNICVGSFCEEGDQLSQWRSYGNDGRGIALGFASPELARVAREHSVRLVRCIYEPALHVKITRDLADLLLGAFRAAGRPEGEARQGLLRQFVSTFLLVAPVVKDHHFGAEREWRLVSMPRPADDPRVTAVLSGNQASVRFVLPLFSDGELHSSIISSVVIGPTVDPENIADAVDVLARQQGFRIPAIGYSRIPYRPQR